MIETKILQIFNRSGLNRQDFANKLGISNAVLSHITSGRNKASLDLVSNILNHFPEISADWLLLDKGDMLRNELEHNGQKIKNQLLSKIENIRQAGNSTLERLELLEKEIIGLK
jgi:transcriptional regulator with XRE-family HTH domain